MNKSNQLKYNPLHLGKGPVTGKLYLDDMGLKISPKYQLVADGTPVRYPHYGQVFTV
ncbi:hypothetical protein LRP52_37130 [Photobacterium sp. ZSDE20]|uniref:Uncharacterized protein n=1 Tax=Photobacterium pectinilyticum TaxID=2906793 RepID=A0ABT1N7B5_9GAMM|nr:hypothetical protein [Photobacterium sp. ZSDE20]MCQ1060616.1 hypothetical protein [Photobacterium sp. ZSDE20]MDD1827811.1 hypothetical protein [Photobacterium sp. ZSDE20]